MAPRRTERLTKFAPVSGSGDEVRLIAGRCTACGKLVFPSPEFCPACAGSEIVAAELPQIGRLYTWSVVHTARPGWVAPFVLGYVDLGPDIRVLAHIVDADPDKLAIDMQVKLRGRASPVDPAVQGAPAYEFVPLQEST